MLEVYGSNWSFQYTEQEWERLKSEGFQLEKEMEEI